MTYSSEFSRTFLTLDRFAQIVGLDPIQFFQGVTTLRSQQTCPDTWMQFSWQDDGKVSREELRWAIKQAEDDLTAQLSYFPAPYWHSETLPYPRFNNVEYRGITGFQAGGFQHKTLNLSRKYVISGGIRATTQIDSNDITRGADIDTTGDGFDDTAVFTVANISFTDICELKAYFKVYNALDSANTRTDPGSAGADDYWEIAPIRATLSGTTATVYIPVYLLFKPQLQRQIDATSIDADVAASYIDTIEFYRVYNNPSSMVTFLWTTESSCSSTACAWATQSGCMRVLDSRTGLVSVSPGTWDATTETFTSGCFSQNREPDKVIVNYYSGCQDQTARNCDELSYYLAETIAMLASAKLNKPVCTCENTARLVQHWQEDLALNNAERTYNINLTDFSNVFGSTKRGAVMAYNRIKNRGVKVGSRIKTM